MVRVEIAGQPLISIDDGVAERRGSFRQTIRKRVRGGQKSMKFAWDNVKPRLVITSDTTEFDLTTISHFQEEGFQISYLAYEGNHKAYQSQLERLADSLEVGEHYAIVAFGDAAALVLEAVMSPMPKLVAVIAYYPPYMPTSNTNFPSTLIIQIHLADSQQFGTRHPSFRYPDTVAGFAEHDLEEFDKTGASLAWSRTLSALRKAFDVEVDLESVWDNHTALEFGEKDADATMKTMIDEPYVNHIPTMTGGIGAKDLRRFYADFFIPNNPESMKLKILSRTVGSDRVVDEMLCTFRHTCEIPWMLPGVPATDKLVEIIVVGIICIRGGKLYHEHLHWDQASVLVQIGLLDPTLIPDSFKTAEPGAEKKIKRIPALGAEAARKAVDETNGESNLLMADW